LIKIGYFKQGVEAMDMSMRVIDYIKETSDALITSEGVLTATNMCERFLFDKGMQYTAIGRLSGGERRRLYLLKVLMEGPNVLLLDEPTNDLDIETLTILEDYLDCFAGIVVTVSHDRYFLDKIVDGLFVFKDKQITYVNGGYSAAIDISDTQKEKASNYEAYKKQKQANKTRKLTWNEKKELEGMDDLLLSLEARIKAIDEEMGSLDDFKKMDELAQKRAALEQELDEKNERYLELMEIEEGQ
jgi:ATP-binding cassette subfamily F protein uup